MTISRANLMISWKSGIKVSKHNWKNVQHKQKNTAWKVSVFSLNARKYRPEKLRIRTLFTQWNTRTLSLQERDFISYLVSSVLLSYYPILKNYPATIYLSKVNSRKTRKMCEICSTKTIKTPMSFWCFDW